MLKRIAAFGVTIAIGGSALACDPADASFRAFLARFKNDGAFRESRLTLPLEFSFTDPEGTTHERLSLAEIRERKMQIIRDDARAAELAGTEGQVCEGVSEEKKDSAVFFQSSCNTDVYGDAYYFVRRKGCWFLQRVEASGG